MFMSRLFVIFACLMAGMGCEQADPQTDPNGILAQLGVSVISLTGETSGGCSSCRDIWSDLNGDGIRDPDELSSGYVGPESNATIVLESQGPLTLNMRLLSASVRLLGGIEEPETYEPSGSNTWDMVFGDDRRSRWWVVLPTTLGEFRVGGNANSPAGEWVWRLTFEVTGPDGQVGISVLESAPFFIEPSFAG